MTNNSTTGRQVYGMFVRNAANLPEEFIKETGTRIDLGWQAGEAPEMLAEELKLRHSLRRPRATKPPRQLAKRVMQMHDNTVAILRKA